MEVWSVSLIKFTIFKDTFIKQKNMSSIKEILKITVLFFHLKT